MRIYDYLSKNHLKKSRQAESIEQDEAGHACRKTVGILSNLIFLLASQEVLKDSEQSGRMEIWHYNEWLQ